MGSSRHPLVLFAIRWAVPNSVAPHSPLLQRTSATWREQKTSGGGEAPRGKRKCCLRQVSGALVRAWKERRGTGQRRDINMDATCLLQVLNVMNQYVDTPTLYHSMDTEKSITHHMFHRHNAPFPPHLPSWVFPSILLLAGRGQHPVLTCQGRFSEPE